MKRIFVRGNTTYKLKASVAAIGVFDGLHQGHQKVIRQAVLEAKRLSVPSVVVTFDPHPVQVIYPLRKFSYITTLEHRLRLIEELGVDVAVVIVFDKETAALKPGQFVQGFLIKQLGVKKIIIGSDFHFGCKARGTIDQLKALGNSYGFDVQSVRLLKKYNIYIKSTYIKELIRSADFKKLKLFLGRDYDFLGEIEHGEARGRKLGYPTANFKQENVVILPSGIYFVRAKCLDLHLPRRSPSLFGLCYVGHKPTFKSKKFPVVYELHLLDFNQRIYGRKVLVEFLRKERDDMKFTDGKSLSDQIARDIKNARHFFLRFK